MTTDGSDRVYTFGGGTASGYSKSTVTMSPAHPAIDAASDSMTIYFRVVNGSIGCRLAGNGAEWTYPTWTLNYTCSTPPSSSGGGGSIKISPMTQYTQKAVQPSSVVTLSPPTYETKKFLVASGQKEE